MRFNVWYLRGGDYGWSPGLAKLEADEAPPPPSTTPWLRHPTVEMWRELLAERFNGDQIIIESAVQLRDS